MELIEKLRILKYNLIVSSQEYDNRYEEHRKFQIDNLENLYAGKFWQYIFSSGDVYGRTYSYCKKIIRNNDKDIFGLFDNFTIYDKMELNEKIQNNFKNSFKRDIVNKSFDFCESEITREEYEEAMNILKDSLFEFVSPDKEKVLVEKYK